MAEAFLQLVLDNLSSLIKEEIGMLMGVNDEMYKLSSTLTTIQAVLEDAEDKQIESKPIRDWLRKLHALAYEIDDILDECATHASRLKRADSKLSRYSLKKLLFRHKIARRMKQVADKLDAVAAEREKFHLREMPVDRSREAAASRETGSLLNESELIFGREEDKEKIVKILVDDVREVEMSILPIIGVGGLGKTTLARQVFNDPRVVEHFEKMIWVCVSDNFDIKTLVKAMIESGTGSGKDSDLQHLDALERRLWELLSKKRYLLVLDDVWNDQQHKWFELRDILSCGSTGSSIVVTTRQRKVADIMGTLPAHCLEGLSDEHCWMLLRRCAFGQNEDVCPNLEVIGKQIVKKCAGVPLAAKALGGILRFKRRTEEWENVRESDMWNLPQEESLILPALRLSYHHLPLQLRQCFAYFAAFPKDHQIEQLELVQLWMAHGYISSKGTLEVEDVGNEICNELVLRSLLQLNSVSYYGQEERLDISMHDLVHDLAQSIMEDKVPGIRFERNVRCASTIREVNLKHKNVLFPKCLHQDMNISSILENRSLRVLDASDTKIEDMPSSIGKLKHLRYLNLSGSEIRILPNSLCTLWNLQILNLNDCSRLEALPKNTRCLRNLRHLCLEYCYSLSEMPRGIRELSLLKTLSIFIVGQNGSNQLEELQYLNLSGSLELHHLERVKHHLDAKKANISEKSNLRTLILIWRNYNRDSGSKFVKDDDEKVLEALQPHPNLQCLSIEGFGGQYLPRWMANSTLGKITVIKIVDCHNCRRLPKLGELPLLQILELQNLAIEFIIEDEVQNKKSVKINFPILEELDLRDLPNLKGVSKEKENMEAFPNLVRLHISSCSSLIWPPLSSLQKLKELKCSSSSLALLSDLDTLTKLSVQVEEKLTCFPAEMLVKFSNLESLAIRGAKEISVTGEAVQALKKIKTLSITECLPEGLVQLLTGLRHLDISDCPELIELPEEIKHLQSLESIALLGLPKMGCLPEALRQLSSLRYLYLSFLPLLGSLPQWLHQLSSLHTLIILYCEKVVSLPALPNLKKLVIQGCPELEGDAKEELERTRTRLPTFPT